MTPSATCNNITWTNNNQTSIPSLLANVTLTPYTVGMGMVATLVLVSGALGNALVCVAVASNKHLQNMTNYFLMSLAVNDFLMVVLVMPFTIIQFVAGEFILSIIGCAAYINLAFLLCTCSTMHLCTLSVDRYLALRYPIKYGRNKTRRRVALKIGFAWIVPVAFALPLTLVASLNDKKILTGGVCSIGQQYHLLLVIVSILFFYIPMLIMMIAHALTLRQLKKVEATNSLRSGDNKCKRNAIFNVESAVEGAPAIEADAASETPPSVKVMVTHCQSTSGKRGRHHESARRATKVLNIIFFTFVILWMPYMVMNISVISHHPFAGKIPPRVYQAAVWLGYTSSSANPVIYTVFNPTFRQTFAKLLNMKVT